MVENKQEVSKDLEKALQALEQAKQRVANEKKKQNEKKRKAEVTYSPRLRGVRIPPEVVCALSEGQVSLAWTLAEGGAPKTGAHGGATIPHRGESATPAP